MLMSRPMAMRNARGAMEGWQLTLFADESDDDQTATVTATPKAPATPTLPAALEPFRHYMIERGLSPNTINSFLGDLELLGRYIGPDRQLGDVDTAYLKDFLFYLRHERGVPCTPKSYARRLTTLKVFFGWLTEDGILPSDPAAPIGHERAKSPLPEILHDRQVDQLLAATEALMKDENKPDARPHLLVKLMLYTGLKKSECMNIKLQDIDNSNPAQPVLHVHYDDPSKAQKERELALPTDLIPILQQYVAQYQPHESLFECTARNLEYVLAAAAERAGLKTLSFELLRMTCAVRDYRAGTPSEKLQKKLGLSPVTWRERKRQIEQLASAPL